MKNFKKNASVLVQSLIVLGVTSLMSSCYGNFTLTKKVYQFNGSLGAEPVKTIIMWIASPVYGFTLGADFLVLNSIEYWTGKKIISQNSSEAREMLTQMNGVDYKVIRSEKEIDIEVLNGAEKGQHKVVFLDENSQTWKDSSGQVFAFATPYVQ
jgi:hypothetical protein